MQMSRKQMKCETRNEREAWERQRKLLNLHKTAAAETLACSAITRGVLRGARAEGERAEKALPGQVGSLAHLSRG